MNVSFVIPAYNAGQALRRTVSSILSQEGIGEFEVIVVDNGSTDASIARLGPHRKLRVVTEHVRGASAARNRGFEAARGDYVAFLDSDVAIEKNWAAECVKTLEGGSVDCVQTPIEPVGDEQKFMTRYRRSIIGEKTKGTFAHLSRAKDELPVVNSSAFMIRRSFVERSGCRFDLALRRCEDLDFTLQLFASGCHFALISTSRAYVTDDRNFSRYVARSFRSGFYTDVVRRMWKFSKPKRTDGARREASPRPASASVDRGISRIGMFAGRLVSPDSSIRRSIVDDEREVAVGEGRLGSRTRMIVLPEETVLFELSRGNRRVLSGQDREKFHALMGSETASSVAGDKLLQELISNGFVVTRESPSPSYN